MVPAAQGGKTTAGRSSSRHPGVASPKFTCGGLGELLGMAGAVQGKLEQSGNR